MHLRDGIAYKQFRQHSGDRDKLHERPVLVLGNVVRHDPRKLRNSELGLPGTAHHGGRGDFVTDAEMLDLVIARTGHGKLRTQVERDPAYWRVVRSLFRVYKDQPPRKVRTSLRTRHHENRIIRSCLYHDPHCGCDLPTCHAGYGDHDDGQKVSRECCLACLKATWRLI